MVFTDKFKCQAIADLGCKCQKPIDTLNAHIISTGDDSDSVLIIFREHLGCHDWRLMFVTAQQ